MRIKVRLKVHQLAKEEVYRGWVRIPEQFRQGPNGGIVPEATVIRIFTGDKSVYSIVRGDLSSSEPTIKLDDNTRERLGINTLLMSECDFFLEVASFWGKLSFFWSHPEPASRFAMRLAVLSVVLGAVGVLVGVAGLLCGRLGKP